MYGTEDAKITNPDTDYGTRLLSLPDSACTLQAMGLSQSNPRALALPNALAGVA